MKKMFLLLLFLISSVVTHALEKQDRAGRMNTREISSCSDQIVRTLLLNVAGRILLVRCRAGEIMSDFALSQTRNSCTEQVSSSVIYGDWKKEVISYKTDQKMILPESIMHPYQIMLYGLVALERAIIYGPSTNKKEKWSIEQTRRVDILLMKTAIESETLSVESAQKVSQELHVLIPTHEIWEENIRNNNLETFVNKKSAYSELQTALESNKENVASNQQSENSLFFVQWYLHTRDKKGKQIECSDIGGVIKE